MPEDHCLASRGLPSHGKGDHRGQVRSYPHTNNGFFFLLIIKCIIFYKFVFYAETQYYMVISLYHKAHIPLYGDSATLMAITDFL